jgi:hypothetical protein
MNDELVTAVREQRNKVHMNVPVEQIISRGRAVRTRRRIPGIAGTLALAAVAAFAVTALLPASHQSGHEPGAQLAAWTVTKQADGTVYVTIRELRDPAGLQSKLRADGLPASVIFGNSPNAETNPCQSYGGGAELQKVFTFLLALGPPPRGHSTAMAIHPSALPGGAGVQIITSQSQVGAHLVTTSQGCTGS